MLTETQYYNLDEAFEKLTKALQNETKIRHEQNLLLDKNYRIMYPVIVKWMNYTNAQIIKALNKKYINKSFQKTEVGKIVTKLTDWGKLEKDGIMMVKPATLEVFETGGNEAFKIAGIRGAFDVVNVEAVNIVNEICSKDIKDILDNTKKSINTLIKTGIQEGQAMGKIAKQIRPLVGLTERQSLAVVHYREKLMAKFPKYNVAKLDKMAKKYSDKLHRYRAETIARTETARAQSEGTLQGYKQLGYKKVEWSANADACSRCMALAGHRFSLQEASGMLPLHPSCLIDAKVPIYTSKKWQRIKDIKVGDLVLTHKGRFRKVTYLHRTPKQLPNVVKIFIKNKVLIVTDNHPVLVNDKWVEAKDIKVGDIVYLLNKDKYDFIPSEVKNIKKWKLRKPKMLYNFSVEEDESYIAKGFVVHNCRCAWISVIEGIKPKVPRVPSIPRVNPNQLNMPTPYSEKVVDKYMKDIKANKKVIPVFVDEKDLEHIVDGLHRATAYKRLGMKVPIFPVNRVDALTTLAQPGMTPEMYLKQIINLKGLPKGVK